MRPSIHGATFVTPFPGHSLSSFLSDTGATRAPLMFRRTLRLGPVSPTRVYVPASLAGRQSLRFPKISTTAMMIAVPSGIEIHGLMP